MEGLSFGAALLIERGVLMQTLQKMLEWMPALLKATETTISLSILSVLTALFLSVFLALCCIFGTRENLKEKDY